MSSLDFALNWGHDDLVPILLDAGADPNGFRATDSRGSTLSPLFAALRGGHVAPINLLLTHGARIEDRNSDGNTALMIACKRPFPGALALLIEKGADARPEHSLRATTA